MQIYENLFNYEINQPLICEIFNFKLGGGNFAMSSLQKC